MIGTSYLGIVMKKGNKRICPRVFFYLSSGIFFMGWSDGGILWTVKFQNFAKIVVVITLV